jgi:predicted AAA+ superfamily ATPase
MYPRAIKNRILDRMFKGKAIVIAGARQTGKTTLALDIVSKWEDRVRIFNCDNPTDRESLTDRDLTFLISLIGDVDVILIDEGQKVSSIGQTVKLLVDHFLDRKQIIITGSSRINFLDMTEEPLTGRKIVFNLFPLSLGEIHPDKNLLSVKKELDQLLIYGSYPEVVTRPSFDEKSELLRELHSSYLYKDILTFQEIRNSDVVSRLIKALALQTGSEVSYNELAGLVGINVKTVEKYIDLLEKCFVIFRLPPFSRNKRREISKMKKIYFYDLGIRNAVINNFNLLENREDVGALWENFLVVERMKYRHYNGIHASHYFWRTYDGSEVDLIEEREGRLFGYEFKWGKRSKRQPVKWMEYPHSSYEIISRDDIAGFILQDIPAQEIGGL